MSISSVEADKARRKLYEAMNEEASFKEKAEYALGLGKEYLGVKDGYVALIDTRTEHWVAIATTDDADGSYPEGLTLELQNTYCRHAIDADTSMAVHDTSQDYDEDAAFEMQDTRCYHGTPFRIDEETYGTVCFVSDKPRNTPFSDDDTMFVELIARMLEYEFKQDRQKAELAKKTDFVTVLTRILRHNLRNDMTVIRGQANLLNENHDADASSEKIIRKTDELLELSETARELTSVVSTDTDRQQVDIAAVTEGVVEKAESEYPSVSFSLDIPDSATVSVKPNIRRVFEELTENAAKHTKDDAQVTVTVEVTEKDVRIHVEDNGTGLPEQERKVLERGKETPLVHGSGLGLWLTNWIVKDNEGRIDTEVDEDGTNITVALPRRATDSKMPNLDVLDRRLQREQDRFEAVFDESFDAMAIVDDEGRFMDVNSRVCELVGVSKENLLGRSVEEFVSDSFWRGLEKPRRQQGILPIIQKNGTERIVEYTVSPDVVSGQHFLVVRDVTEREENEREIAEANRQLQTVMETVDAAVFIKDADGRYQMMNGECRELLGVGQKEDVVGLTDYDLLPEETAEKFRDDDMRVFEEGETVRTEDRIPTPDGTREFLTVKSPFFDDEGELSGVCAVSMDIADSY
jgi:PAS domain S-box-containing protein